MRHRCKPRSDPQLAADTKGCRVVEQFSGFELKVGAFLCFFIPVLFFGSAVIQFRYNIFVLGPGETAHAPNKPNIRADSDVARELHDSASFFLDTLGLTLSFFVICSVHMGMLNPEPLHN